MVGFFSLVGIWLLVNRNGFASTRSYFCSFRLDEPLQARLTSAYQRRELSEALPSSQMAALLAALALVLAVVGAFSHVPVVLLYATDVVALASVLTIAYLRLRRLTIRRVATLQVRDPNAIAPWHAWTLVATTVVSPLLWLPSEPIASLLITTAGIVIVALARQVATMPALLTGTDVVVETFVDTRLRSIRAFNLLAIALAPSFVFEAFTGYRDSVAHCVAMGIGSLALVVMMWMQVRLLRRHPTQIDMRMWIDATL